MTKKATKKRVINSDPTTWDIKPHWGIPQELIDCMAKLKGFSMSRALFRGKKAFEMLTYTLDHNPILTRYKGVYGPGQFLDLAQGKVEQILSRPDKIRHFDCEMVIECCFVADQLQRWAEQERDKLEILLINRKARTRSTN